MASNSDQDSWSTVVRNEPRTRSGHNTSKAKTHPQSHFQTRSETRPEKKRARISTGSTLSTSSAGGPLQKSLDMPLDDFQNLNVDDKLNNIFLCLQGMQGVSERLLATEQNVRDLRDQANNNTDKLTLLAYKSIDAEARQRRNNLLFWGIPEAINEDCLLVIREFLSDKLSLDPDSICVQRAHRIGRLKHAQPGRGRQVKVRHRPLIVAFRDFQDCELILSSASKLKGTGFGVSRDYPHEIVEARKPLRAEMKSLRAKHPNAKLSILYPAELTMDGRTYKDMFPQWREYMRRDRLPPSTSGCGSSTESNRDPKPVFEKPVFEDLSLPPSDASYSSDDDDAIDLSEGPNVTGTNAQSGVAVKTGEDTQTQSQSLFSSIRVCEVKSTVNGSQTVPPTSDSPPTSRHGQAPRTA